MTMTLSDRIIDWTIDHVMGWFLLLCVAALVFCIGAAIYAGYSGERSPKIELNKNEWTCTHNHQVTTTTYVLAGKVLVPITETSNICDNYTMDGYE